jgi:hypothetical protein
MTDPSDTKDFSQARLCELAQVRRGKHRRWLAAKLLRKKGRYVLADVMRAALLDEINEALKPQAARSVWLAIREEIGIPGKRLELLVTLSTHKAQLVRSDAELAKLIPHGDPVVLLDLSSRAEAVNARVREHLVALSNEVEGTDRLAGQLANADTAAEAEAE